MHSVVNALNSIQPFYHACTSCINGVHAWKKGVLLFKCFRVIVLIKLEIIKYFIKFLEFVYRST